MAQPMRAGINLVDTVDAAFDARDTDLVLRTLGDIDPFSLHAETLIVFLSNVRDRCIVAGPPVRDKYIHLRERTMIALDEVHGWTVEERNDAERVI